MQFNPAVAAAAFLLLAAPLSAQEDAAPVNRSFTAFTIPEKDLLPENVAYDARTKSFLVGSTRKGKIVRVDSLRGVHEFVAPRAHGLWMVIGMKADAPNRDLWVASSNGGNLEAHDATAPQSAAIFRFDLDDGSLRRRYDLPAAAGNRFLNDLVITPAGDVFVTHMFDEPGVWVLRRGRDELTRLPVTPGFTLPNGITSDERGTLFLAHREGISVVDAATGERRQLDDPDQLRSGGIDGLYYHAGALVAIHPAAGLVRRYRLDAARTRIIAAETLEARHPMFGNPTTGVIVDAQLFYIANAQFDRIRDGVLRPMEELYEPVILRLPLSIP
ncbi:MAG TPA: hypothetical protein VK928_00675 [Longimicrobiales bacterium]|nr:hypothetical protein [Longimicrobiales bacterium]